MSGWKLMPEGMIGPYSMQTDGVITNVEVFGYQKRYNPEKYYVSRPPT